MRIELPEDNWAELRDPSEVPERLRRPIVECYSRVAKETFNLIESMGPDQIAKAVASDNPEDLDAKAYELYRQIPPAEKAALFETNDHCINAMVKEWSFELPCTIDGVLDLPHDSYDALKVACAPVVKDLFVKFSPSADPKSPTVPSSASNGHSGAEPSTAETPSPPSGEPISSLGSI